MKQTCHFEYFFLLASMIVIVAVRVPLVHYYVIFNI